ncbi:uncharacterized protein F5891DRAFT_986429 [Suillus fuscotomentosus]|uniref:Uncharacterized protein n=1 Tax=Suillus fuscotomentosus TaxID=1912939 RepID=A0AAD4DRY6_9AGAM|nr:uncharacterized protein F5891DRAFT_986429 [Suillus fuscotomentosus]KAG1891936.1 hypothetical protein F5891DRAFT_986429 [Suillus fuscotomentosus]
MVHRAGILTKLPPALKKSMYCNQSAIRLVVSTDDETNEIPNIGPSKSIRMPYILVLPANIAPVPLQTSTVASILTKDDYANLSSPIWNLLYGNLSGNPVALTPAIPNIPNIPGTIPISPAPAIVTRKFKNSI